MPQVLPDELMSLAKRIKSKISEQVITLDNDRTIQFTLSIGIAQIIHNSDTDIENIINRADQALYAATPSISVHPQGIISSSTTLIQFSTRISSLR